MPEGQPSQPVIIIATTKSTGAHHRSSLALWPTRVAVFLDARCNCNVRRQHSRNHIHSRFRPAPYTAYLCCMGSRGG